MVVSVTQLSLPGKKITFQGAGCLYIQPAHLDRVFLWFTFAAEEGVGDDQRPVLTIPGCVHIGNKGHRLGMITAYGTPAKTAHPVGRSVTVPAVHRVLHFSQ